MSFSSRLINIMFTKGDNKRDAGLTTPEDVIRFDDIRYGEDEACNMLDIYKPRAETNDILPVIISIHGGGWVYGDKERYQYYCMSLARYGFAVINFTYRLAPAYKFPSQMEDINDVVKWALANNAQYGLDTRNVFLVGDSAGAHMAALYSCACTNQQYAGKHNWKVPDGFTPAGVALNCGVYEADKANKKDRMLIRLMKDLLETAEDNQYELISPIRHVSEAFPPTYLMTCKGDFLLEQSGRMAKKLEEKQVPHIFKVFGTEEKPLYHVFHCNMREPEALTCNKEECEFFRMLIIKQINNVNSVNERTIHNPDLSAAQRRQMGVSAIQEKV